MVIGEDEFYATNDHYFGFSSKLVRFLETFSMLRLGSIVYCKESHCEMATNNEIGFPNGIHRSVVLEQAEKLFPSAYLCFTSSLDGQLTAKKNSW